MSVRLKFLSEEFAEFDYDARYNIYVGFSYYGHLSMPTVKNICNIYDMRTVFTSVQLSKLIAELADRYTGFEVLNFKAYNTVKVLRFSYGECSV